MEDPIHDITRCDERCPGGGIKRIRICEPSDLLRGHLYARDVTRVYELGEVRGEARLAQELSANCTHVLCGQDTMNRQGHQPWINPYLVTHTTIMISAAGCTKEPPGLGGLRYRSNRWSPYSSVRTRETTPGPNPPTLRPARMGKTKALLRGAVTSGQDETG